MTSRQLLRRCRPCRTGLVFVCFAALTCGANEWLRWRGFQRHTLFLRNPHYRWVGQTLTIEALRIVLAARWNHLDRLEIRVQRNESRRRIEEWHKEEWHKQVWLMLEPAVVRSQFAEWPLKAPMKRIALEAEKHSKIDEFRDAGVLDRGIKGSFGLDIVCRVDVGLRTIFRRRNLFDQSALAKNRAREEISPMLTWKKSLSTILLSAVSVASVSAENNET